MTRHALWLCLALVSCSLAGAQQQQARTTTAATSTVPHVVKFNGIANDASGKPLSGTIGVTFDLYRDQQGGAALWIETQNVKADAVGHHAVQLGATQPEGIPIDLFASGDARWLGVHVEGAKEQPRVLLLSVPYALKAADADTLGGKPPSAFVVAQPKSTNDSPVSKPKSATDSSMINPAITGTGTTNFRTKQS